MPVSRARISWSLTAALLVAALVGAVTVPGSPPDDLVPATPIPDDPRPAPARGATGVLEAVTVADGTVTQAQFVIDVQETSEAPNVGDMAVASENRTLATEPDLSKLSSDPEPNPAFYQMTVKEAMASKRPSVVSFTTPAFCQTAICAPVLDSAKAVYTSLGDEVNFIHIEVYQQFNPELVLADEMSEWNLVTEPWTYVLDDSGRIAARLGGPVSPLELTAVLEPLLP